MTGIVEAISAGLGIIKEWLGIKSKRLEHENTQAMKDRERAAQEQQVKDEARRALAQGKLDEVRKGVSLLLALGLLAGLLGACAGVVAPEPVVGNTVAFDGTNQNAGVVSQLPGGRLLVTAGARDRYNALVDLYGQRLRPPRVRDSGLSPTGTNTWAMDPEAAVDWWFMNWLDKQRPK